MRPALKADVSSLFVKLSLTDYQRDFSKAPHLAVMHFRFALRVICPCHSL